MKKILLLVLLLIIMGFVYYVFNYYKSDKNNNQKKVITNEFENIDYFIKNNLNRYENYKKLHNYDNQKTVLYVNMNLDYEFYDENIIKTAKHSDDTLILVNKYNKIDENFIPVLKLLNSKYTVKNLEVTPTVKIAFEKMCEQSLKENLNIKAVSAYRSYTYQLNLYNNYVLQDGITAADKYSARAGFSEHNTGLAIDIQGGSISYLNFDQTKEYNWIENNAHLYGFIIRYPKEKDDITGYQYEPWHIRYVGVDVATYIYNNNITFDEYYAMFLIK